MMDDRGDALLNAAQAVDYELAGSGEPGASAGEAGTRTEEPKLTTEQELKFALELGVKTVAHRFPSIAQVWTDEKRAEVARAVAPVFDKYGVSLFGFLEEWKEELMCAVVVVPLMWETAAMIRLDLEREAAQRAKPVRPEPPAAPASE